MGCAFCATGKEGFTRNLSAGEIVEQVLIVQTRMGKRVSNVVAMGCGLLVDSNFLSSSIFSNKDYAIDLFTYLVGIGE